MSSTLDLFDLFYCRRGGISLEDSLEFGRLSFFTHHNLILLSLGRLNTIAISSMINGFYVASAFHGGGWGKKWTIHIIAAHRLKMMEIAGPRCRGLIHADCDS